MQGSCLIRRKRPVIGLMQRVTLKGMSTPVDSAVDGMRITPRLPVDSAAIAVEPSRLRSCVQDGIYCPSA
jgi:hypothetical protein